MYIYCTIYIIYNIQQLCVIVHYYSMLCRHMTIPVKQMVSNWSPSLPCQGYWLFYLLCKSLPAPPDELLHPIPPSQPESWGLICFTASQQLLSHRRTSSTLAVFVQADICSIPTDRMVPTLPLVLPWYLQSLSSQSIQKGCPARASLMSQILRTMKT